MFVLPPHDKLLIPLWSDFILFKYKPYKLSKDTFNPTMVWFYLSDYQVVGARAVIPTFNPTMVWFYLNYSTAQQNKKEFTFQSHYGLILSYLNSCTWRQICDLSIPLWSDFIMREAVSHVSSAKSFQSHYGLILSRTHNTRSNRKKASFNPTMVWFYLQNLWSRLLSPTQTLSIPLWSDFIWSTENIPCVLSYYLSIPLWSDFIHDRYLISIMDELNFQSHYGLILSCKQSHILQRSTRAFNPTMVWFYPVQFKKTAFKHFSFNPTMVWFYRYHCREEHVW